MNWALYGAALSANLVSLIGGGAYYWTSPVLPKLNGIKDIEENPLGRPITPFEESWIVSLVSLGASIGPFIGGSIVDRIGRKKTILLLTVPMIISHLILAFATDINYYYFSRFFLGLGVGCVYSLVPMYVGEISENYNRGTLGCIMAVMINFGGLLCYIIGPFVSIKIFSLICLVPPIASLILFGLFAPESPYYFVMVYKEEEAKSALKKLRNGPVDKELEEIKRNVENSKMIQIKFGDLIKSKAITKGLMIGFGLMYCQQFSGISALLSYMQSIFDAAGSTIPPEISPIIVGTVQVLTNITTTQLIDRVGRKLLLLTSLLGMFIAHVTLGLYFYLKANNFDDVVAKLFWLPVCSLMLFIIMYGIAAGPVAWVMMSELFPPNFKAIATTLCSFFCLFSAFLLMVFFPNINVIIGMAPSIWIFAAFCGLGFIFVWRVVPETKGKSFSEIQSSLEGNCKMYE